MKTSGELRHDFYEWFDENPNKRIWDWVRLQLEQQDYKQSIIGLIDGWIAELNDSNDRADEFGVHILSELKEEIEAL